MKLASLIFSTFLCSTVCLGELFKISIYYETLCPDSIRFFRYQFEKTYRDFLPYMEVDFLPYGKARQSCQNGNWNFQCQHGQKECVGNRFHACALAQGNGKDKDVKFISCCMSKTNPTSTYTWMECANSTNIPYQPIYDCFKNGHGHELLAKYGDRTAALQPKLSYVPTIVFDDVYDQSIQNSAETNLRGTICKYLNNKPPVCY